MQGTIIADTTCLIVLEKIGELNLLKDLYSSIAITSEVALEYGTDLPPWIQIHSPENKNYQKILEASLDSGEAASIALAIELPDSLLILDDGKGRKFAENLGIKYTGTLGVLLAAKAAGVIPVLLPILEKIKSTNFRITPDMERKVLLLAGEE
jgi:predicted nucleic acid-binding protein